jgi:DNA-binding transcriptional LysR family regulator
VSRQSPAASRMMSISHPSRRPALTIPTAYLGTSAPWRGADSAHLLRTDRSSIFSTPAKLDAFVAVAEEGGFSAAARRVHIGQPALSQTVNAIERQFALKLLERSSTRVRATDPGLALLTEARATPARHDQLLQTMAAYTADGEGLVRLGMPFEIDPDVLRERAQFAEGHPLTRLVARHLSTSAQLAALCSGRRSISYLVSNDRHGQRRSRLRSHTAALGQPHPITSLQEAQQRAKKSAVRTNHRDGKTQSF